MLTQGDAEMFRPLWSADVLPRLGGVLAREADLPEGAVSYRIEQMHAAFPDAEVTGYETLIDGMTNHEKDRHVLAAAVRGFEAHTVENITEVITRARRNVRARQ